MNILVLLFFLVSESNRVCCWQTPSARLHINESVDWIRTNERIESAHFDCGVYALAAAANALETNVVLEDFLSDEFVTPGQGSSTQQISNMAQALSLQALPLQDLNIIALFSFSEPVLLNLRRNSQATDTISNHWVCFLGQNVDNTVRIFDPAYPSIVRSISTSELLLEWNGYAIAISKHDATNSKSQLLASVVWTSISWYVLLLVTAYSLPYMLVTRGGLLPNKRSWLLFLGVVVLVWMFSICFLPTCLVFDSSLRGWLVAQNRVRLVPRISLKEFLAEYALFQKAEGAKVVFADGRDLAAFSSLQLADSQCFHVDMSLTDYRQKTGDLGKSETLYIVFCAATDCPWDDIAANRLLAAGANKVVVFDGGMKALFESGRFKIVGNKMHLND